MRLAPLPDGWYELRPLTFYEQALDALRLRRKFRNPPPEYPGPATKTVLTRSDEIFGDSPG